MRLTKKTYRIVPYFQGKDKIIRTTQTRGLKLNPSNKFDHLSNFDIRLPFVQGWCALGGALDLDSTILVLFYPAV